MATERELLARAQSWEREALAEIYDRYSPGLYRYAMRLLGNADQAEECVAESFEKLLRAFHRGAGPDKHLQAYLYRIAHNWITDFYRRPGVVSEELDESMAGAKKTEADLLQKLEAQNLRQALSRLTEEQRQVLALKHLEGLRNQEVAQVIKKSVGAVKALEQRGLASLERLLQAETKINDD